ncbi:hypothetical protein A2960_01705 [Candidatus Gottesmanbacteria bacterium RIFCSPLOWO2_01_FULL_39_12b]|uniref:Uncharacterized protein n=1 Tax=Candidatus Gottesmanbacteria bacterium RIFCSPLOWO2_01_FULL_39_12b TaxID=1798388 RepID=A0A1F6AQB3_9BACT|nr:MAG: hypothetical protein A2960_01705 [Candidatus Gottesmanbacteria bacterium RIFCSPLOWO2_01_FULL_39_12b]
MNGVNQNQLKVSPGAVEITIGRITLEKISTWFASLNVMAIVAFFASVLSGFFWIYFSSRGYNLTYNDAMSHLDIARRVVEGVKPGLAQLGSVWLPLPHILMLPTIWNDFFWHSGLSGGIPSMISYVLACIFTYKSIRLLGGTEFGALIGTAVVALNTNFLYLQTTALTEPLFLGTFILATYYLIRWAKTQDILSLVIAAFFILLTGLTRYDGWFLLVFALFAVFLSTYFKNGWKKAEGTTVLFGTLASLGVIVWFVWNLVIFGNPLYFATSEFSAGAQQERMYAAGVLLTKGDILFSLKTYFFSMIDNIGVYIFFFGLIGWVYFMVKNKNIYLRAAGAVLLAPMVFNILSLYLGQSALFLPETMGNSWFNVRYGIVVLPWAAICIGFLVSTRNLLVKILIPAIILLEIGLSFSSHYSITIVDGLVGASQKNVTLIGSEINQYAGKDNGLILASVASHDAILFSSGLPMRRFIHEGTGKLWMDSLQNPDQYAQYIIMRSGDGSDSVSRAMMKLESFPIKYRMVYKGDFADFYERISFPPQQ